MFLSFGPNSPYDRETGYSKGMTDRSSYPIQGKWQNQLLKRFARLHAEGKLLEDMKEEDKNKDPDNFIRNIPLIAMLAGKPELLDTLQDSIFQFQSNDLIVAFVTAIGRLVECYVLDGDDPRDPDRHPLERVARELKRPGRACPDDLDLAVAGHLNKVMENRDISIAEATLQFGVA